MSPIPRHYGACAVAPGIIKKEHATGVYASNPTMAAAPDCSLYTAEREGGMEGGPHEEPSRWVPSVFCLEIYSKIFAYRF